jgi:hypothetical protein
MNRRPRLSIVIPVALAGCLARLAPGKGFGSFIRAAALIAAAVPNAVFVIAGKEVNPGYAALLQELAQRWNILDVSDARTRSLSLPARALTMRCLEGC